MHEVHSSMKKHNRRSVFLMRLKRKILSNVLLARLISFSAVVLVLLIIFYFVFLILRGVGLDKYVRMARYFIFTPNGVVNQLDGRTNFLILGKAGDGYTAPDLTDTMILASISHDDPKLIMVSLPRDLWIEDLRAKLNSVYYWGNQKEENGGLVLAKSIVEEVVGVPIHYALVIDFDGFRELIDAVGGVDIDVQKTFTDNRFPIPGKEDDDCGGNDEEYLCRYESITFTNGLQHMDGTTALKFARSRHSEDLAEGTDLARARRQQLVLNALKDKMFSREIILNFKKLREISGLIDKTLETDLNLDQEVYLSRKIYDARNRIETHVLPEELLENPPISSDFDNLYVFVPLAGDWSEVQSWVKSILP